MSCHVSSYRVEPGLCIVGVEITVGPSSWEIYIVWIDYLLICSLSCVLDHWTKPAVGFTYSSIKRIWPMPFWQGFDVIMLFGPQEPGCPPSQTSMEGVTGYWDANLPEPYLCV